MIYFFAIIFGVLPSLIWLFFYLRKDVHPESNRMVLKIFFYGILIALPAIFIEIGIQRQFEKLVISPFLILILNTFIGVALVEEFLKYLVIQEKILNNSEFDEPIDAMLYMIIAGLGFAAIENVLTLFILEPPFLIKKILEISILRFLGTTFLHALCSGLIGYFLALSFFESKKRIRLIVIGLIMASFFHGLYNFSIREFEGNLQLAIPIIILISLAIFLNFAFKHLKKLKSICKIE